MHLIDHDRAQAGEHGEAVGVAEQQRQRFGRGEEDLRRLHPLAGLAIRRGVAGAGFDADVDAHFVEAHFIEGRDEVALNVDRQRLQRRDIEGVEPLGRLLDQFRKRGEEAGERLARAGRGNEQRVPTGAALGEHVELVAARRPAPRREPVGQRGRK